MKLFYIQIEETQGIAPFMWGDAGPCTLIHLFSPLILFSRLWDDLWLPRSSGARGAHVGVPLSEATL